MPATRIKCCMCGIQVHQNRLNLDYPLVELSTFVGAGRGRGFLWQKNVEVNDPERTLLKLLRDRLKGLLDRVERKLCGSETMEPSVLGTSVLSFPSVSRVGSISQLTLPPVVASLGKLSSINSLRE